MRFHVLPTLELKGGTVAGFPPGGLGLLEGVHGLMDAGMRTVRIVDQDAQFGRAPQWHHVSRILGTGLRVHLGGGLRSMVHVQQVLDLGVDVAIVGERARAHPAWAREVATLFPGRVGIQIPHERGRIGGPDGPRVEDLVAGLAHPRLAGMYVDDVARRSAATGLDLGPLLLFRALAPGVPWIGSGGVATLEQARQASEAGLAGVGVYPDVVTADTVSRMTQEFPHVVHRPFVQVVAGEEE